LPIYSDDIDDYIKYNKCECDDGCNKCQIIYRLNEVCHSLNMQIKTTSIEIYNDNINENENENSDYNKPKFVPDIDIIRLYKNQVVDILCYARKGIGKEHMKWSAINVCIPIHDKNNIMYDSEIKNFQYPDCYNFKIEYDIYISKKTVIKYIRKFLSELV